MVQFPVGARDFLVFKALRLALGLTELAVQSGPRASLHGVKWPRCEAHLSCPT